MNTQAPASAWPSASGSWSGIRVASGSNQNPEKDLPSPSASPSDSAGGRERPHILIIEDNRADLFLIREAIESVWPDPDLQVVHDGESAIKLFERLDGDSSIPHPDLVILDINLPKKHGGEVLHQMRKSQRCGNALVLVVTSSNSDRDRQAMASLGVNGYFRKPSGYEDFMKLGEVAKAILAGGPAT
jgi:CheY-like chemotaxis protein